MAPKKRIQVPVGSAKATASDEQGPLVDLKAFLLKNYSPYIKQKGNDSSDKGNPGSIMSEVSQLTKDVLSVMEKEITDCTESIKKLSGTILQTGKKQPPAPTTLQDMIHDLRLRVTRSEDLLKQLVEFSKDEDKINLKLSKKTLEEHGSPKSKEISEVIADMEKSVEQVAAKIKFYREWEKTEKINTQRLGTLLSTFSVCEKSELLKPSDKTQTDKTTLKQPRTGGEMTMGKPDAMEDVIKSLENAICKEKKSCNCKKTASQIKELELYVVEFNIDPGNEEEEGTTTTDGRLEFIKKTIAIQNSGHLKRYKDILENTKAHLGIKDVAAHQDKNPRQNGTPKGGKDVEKADTQIPKQATAMEMKRVIKDLLEFTENKDGNFSKFEYMVRDLVQSINKIHLELTSEDFGQEGMPLFPAIMTAGEKMNKCEKAIEKITTEIVYLSKSVKADKEVNTIKVMADKVQLINEKVSDVNKTAQEKETAIADFKRKITDLKQENQELLVRLSKYAGAQLRDNNPNITDLSDPNRPTKLAEEFSKLYDDEWTNAFDEMENIEDTVAIDRLYRVLKEREPEQKFPPVISTLISDFRKATATVTMNSIVQAFETRDDEKDKLERQDKPATMEKPKSDSSLPKPQNSKTAKRTPKAGRGKNDSGTKPDGSPQEVGKSRKQDLKASILSDKSSANTQAMQIYTRRCVELCWLAVVQEPPLYIDFATTAGNKLDTDCYRLYTKQGKNIDYVVWPAVFLEQGKGLLSKGVAQGK